MLDTILSQIFFSQWIVIAVAAVLLLAATEIGYRFGLRLHRAKDEARKGQIGGIQGAILGLLGLLLGFTFAMAVGRYESRRALVLQEANAIGTTYLRAALLPGAHQSDVENLLRRYVDVRLDFYDAGEDRAQQANAEQKAAQIQQELWAHAVASAKEAPSPLAVSFITSLNETIDLDATRMNALRTHVPGAVWLLVLAIAACGCCASGYAAGAHGARSIFANWVLPLLIAVVITLIADLDRPRGGLIGIKQQPLIDLKQSLSNSQSKTLSNP
ncbi:MAG TPA: hypothetical protein VGJ04_02845 [Pirellulales bacterium]